MNNEPTIGDSVFMDGNKDIKGLVTAINYSLVGTTYEVTWWHNGNVHQAWFAVQRLERIDPYALP